SRVSPNPPTFAVCRDREPRSVIEVSRRLLAVFTAIAVGATSTAAVASPTSSGTGASALSPELPAGLVAASSGPHSTWRPDAAIYGTASQDDVPVTMADGTVLRVNVIYPTDNRGREASGPFPVLLT